MASAPSGNVLKTGWLVKRGAIIPSWKRRYFIVFSERKLYYFTNVDRRECKGDMDLAGTTVTHILPIDASHAKYSRPHCIEIASAKRKLILCADSEDDAKQWTALLSAVANNTPIPAGAGGTGLGAAAASVTPAPAKSKPPPSTGAAAGTATAPPATTATAAPPQQQPAPNQTPAPVSSGNQYAPTPSEGAAANPQPAQNAPAPAAAGEQPQSPTQQAPTQQQQKPAAQTVMYGGVPTKVNPNTGLTWQQTEQLKKVQTGTAIASLFATPEQKQRLALANQLAGQSMVLQNQVAVAQAQGALPGGRTVVYGGNSAMMFGGGGAMVIGGGGGQVMLNPALANVIATAQQMKAQHQQAMGITPTQTQPMIFTGAGAGAVAGGGMPAGATVVGGGVAPQGVAFSGLMPSGAIGVYRPKEGGGYTLLEQRTGPGDQQPINMTSYGADAKLYEEMFLQTTTDKDARFVTGLGLILKDPMSTDEITRVVQFVERAANDGSANAQYVYAYLLQAGIPGHVERDLPRANKYFGLAAAQGLRTAQCAYGMALLAGNGIQRDQIKAANLFFRAAEQGELSSMYQYATCVIHGIDSNGMVSADPHIKKLSLVEAAKWFARAASMGYAAAEPHAAWFQLTTSPHPAASGDFERSCVARLQAVLTKSGAAGENDARYYLGQCYEHSYGGLMRDAKQAKALYELGARAEHQNCKNGLTGLLTVPPSIRQIQLIELKLVKKLGSGSFGEAWQAVWKGAEVVVKFVNGSRSDDQTFFAFRDEAILLDRLKIHPHVTPFVGVVITPDQLGLVLQFASHGTVEQQLITNQKWKDIASSDSDRRTVIQMMVDAAAALSFLHAEHPPIIHRDVATRNLLLNSVDRVWLNDFGMSRLLNAKTAAAAGGGGAAADVKDDSGKTLNNVGPVRWMAPESMKNSSYSTKSDVWMYV